MLQEILPYIYNYGWLLGTSILLMAFYQLFLVRRHSYHFMRTYLLAIPVVCLVQIGAFAYHALNASDEAPVVMEMTQQEADAYIAEHPQREVIFQEMPTQTANNLAQGEKSTEVVSTSPDLIEHKPAAVPAATPMVPFSLYQILKWMFIGIAAISGFLLLLVLVPLLQMQYKIRRMPSTRSEDGYRIVRSSHVNTPFSFCRTIFLPIKCTTSAESVFLKHEKAHITCAHYIDVWSIEVLVRLLWFNPILWYVRKVLRDLHEFEADRCVLQSGEDLHTYQTLLLGEIGEECSVVANGFNKSFIRRRILEMRQATPQLLGRGRKIMTATWMLLLFGVFAMYAFPRKSSVVLHIKPNDARALPLDTCYEVEGVDTCFASVEEEKNKEEIMTDSVNTEIKVDSTEVALDRIKKEEEKPVAVEKESTVERPTHDHNGWRYVVDLPLHDLNDQRSVRVRHDDNETFITFAKYISSDDEVVRFGGPDSYIVDTNTGVHYKARRSIPSYAWHYFHILGMKGKIVDITVVFPRIPDSAEWISFYQVTSHLQSGERMDVKRFLDK